MRVPKFHSRGIPRGHLFTLAFVNGFYGSPSARKKSLQKKDEAFFLLEFSRSKGFTQFMYLTVSANNHHLLAYSRGIDELRTLDLALLGGWHEDQIPPYA